jgi:hypothetical protein
MNPSTLLLLALKGTCALNCLAALHLAGPLPVAQRTIMDLTGFDDAAVSKGLATLRVLGLVTCTGDKHRTAWALSPAARNLPVPLEPFLASPDNLDSEVLKEEEEELSTDETNNPIDSSSILEPPNPQNPESDPSVLPAGNQQSSSPELPANNLKSSASPAPGQFVESGPTGSALTQGASDLHPAGVSHSSPPGQKAPHSRRRADRALRSQFYAAFEAAGIYLQFRRPLADALLAAEDGPAWLRQTLGWLCYAERRLPHVKRGAVVYISLRDRLPCDPAYLPPPELPFDAALAWALRAGEAEPNDDNDDGVDNDVNNATASASAIDLPLPPSRSCLGKIEGRGAGGVRSSTPEADLWQALIARLARELSPAVIDSQLRPASLLSLGADRCLIGVPTPQSRDWLRTRLAAVLARALAELTGRALSVEIVVDN